MSCSKLSSSIGSLDRLCPLLLRMIIMCERYLHSYNGYEPFWAPGIPVYISSAIRGGYPESAATHAQDATATLLARTAPGDVFNIKLASVVLFAGTCNMSGVLTQAIRHLESFLV